MRWLAAILILFYGTGAAFADIRIDVSRYVNGRTTISGKTGPDQTVTLDNKYKTKSNGDGDFEFSVKYKPSDCMSDIKSGDDVYSAVIAGCFDSGVGNLTTPINTQP